MNTIANGSGGKGSNVAPSSGLGVTDMCPRGSGRLEEES